MAAYGNVFFDEMWEEQDGKCGICGALMDKSRRGTNAATLDHITPKSRGGRDTRDNLQLAHEGCNRQKGNRWVW